MYDYLIYKQLKKYNNACKSFHVPGHKGRGEFLKLFPSAEIDVTELSYSDNLFCPDGVIAMAQQDIANILGAKKSYILTDGSTCGVLSMLYVLSKRGSKVLVPRNCHQSVWNACKLFKLEPVILRGQFAHGVCLPPEPEEVQRHLKADGQIAGMIALSPDYYGNIAPLKEYSEILQSFGKLLLVDEAHGAHLAFECENGAYAGVYADLWVDGAHKSLPTLTQGAVLSLNNEELIADLEEALATFRTTSPSYPVMASVEYGVKFIANNLNVSDAAKQAVTKFKNSVPFNFYNSGDWTKLAIDFKPLNISSDKAAQFLEKCGIYSELSDGRYILFYLSPQITNKDLNKLQCELLKLLKEESLQNTYIPRKPLPQNARACTYQNALCGDKEFVPLESAQGRVCAGNAGVTPPCIPVIVGGELITKEAVTALLCAKNTFGVTDGEVAVVK